MRTFAIVSLFVFGIGSLCAQTAQSSASAAVSGTEAALPCSAQWACENDRPEDARLRALTDPHSPAEYRINGVVVNMPEFAQAFSCKAGQPMTKPPDQVCRVW